VQRFKVKKAHLQSGKREKRGNLGGHRPVKDVMEKGDQGEKELGGRGD